jgi:hypothetical protein
MISFTLVLATGVKLIMIPFASASGPSRQLSYLPIISEPYSSRTKLRSFPATPLRAYFDKEKAIAYNQMQP